MPSTLSHLRTTKGWSSRQAAEACGCSQAQYSGVESGDRTVTAELAQAIAKAFSTKPERLFAPVRYQVKGG